MEFIIVTNLFAILFAFLEDNDKIKKGLIFSFSFLFLFLGLRYDFGNDYSNYLTIFNNISNGIVKLDFDDSFATEVGWIYLCQLFKPLGFFIMIAFLAVIYCIIFYSFIKKYAPVKYYWLSLIILLFNPFLFLVQSSAMRQTIALLLFLFSSLAPS